MAIKNAPEDSAVGADRVPRTRIQRRIPTTAIFFILVDVDEDDVTLTSDDIALCLKPVPAPDVLGQRRQEIVGGNQHGSKQLAIQLIVVFSPLAHDDGRTVVKPRHQNRFVILHRRREWKWAAHATGEYDDQCKGEIPHQHDDLNKSPAGNHLFSIKAMDFIIEAI
jgi:hypothetical protein